MQGRQTTDNIILFSKFIFVLIFKDCRLYIMRMLIFLVEENLETVKVFTLKLLKNNPSTL